MATAVISGRVEEAVRQRADVVLRKAGLKPTDVIQAVWASIANTGEIPEVALPQTAAPAQNEAMDKLASFLDSLPPINSEFANWNDDDILALKARDHE